MSYLSNRTISLSLASKASSGSEYESDIGESGGFPIQFPLFGVVRGRKRVRSAGATHAFLPLHHGGFNLASSKEY